MIVYLHKTILILNIVHEQVSLLCNGSTPFMASANQQQLKIRNVP